MGPNVMIAPSTCGSGLQEAAEFFRARRVAQLAEGLNSEGGFAPLPNLPPESLAPAKPALEARPQGARCSQTAPASGLRSRIGQLLTVSDTLLRTPRSCGVFSSVTDGAACGGPWPRSAGSARG